MPRQLVNFSTLALVYKEQERQNQQQQQDSSVKKKIIIKPKVILAPAPIPALDHSPAHLVASPISENHYLESESDQREQRISKRKIIIKKKVSQIQIEKEEKQTRVNKKIIIKNKLTKRYNCKDIAPPASIYYIQQNDIYRTPPPNCCRFFIENKSCFLRESDNACICPISRTVIGFWNEKVGKECKLLPIQHETTYEETTVQEVKVIDIDSPSPSPSPIASSASFPQTTPTPTSSKNINSLLISKPRFVSDAQRARIASEPVALLREKLAKRYGMNHIKMSPIKTT
jgi:hypothetical protein